MEFQYLTINQKLIIVQQWFSYRFICFRVWEIVWSHIQSGRTTNYPLISVISLITSDFSVNQTDIGTWYAFLVLYWTFVLTCAINEYLTIWVIRLIIKSINSNLLRNNKECWHSTVNPKQIIIQQKFWYHIICFRVWEIVWNHFRTHWTTNYP